MAKRHHPHRGSHGYSPRKRADRPIPRVRSWPEDGDQPCLQGFAGYKAGMTHAIMTDYRPTSVTSGADVVVPATVIECPPMRVAAVRIYRRGPYGLKVATEAWSKKLVPELKGRVTIPAGAGGKLDDVPAEDVDDVRVLAHTIPKMVPGVDKKVPDLMEIRVGGPDVASKIEYATGLLGKEVKVDDVLNVGQQLDALAITKGKGFQGSIKRWGVKLQSHKSSKPRRKASPLGPFRPPYIRPTVPMPGQTGYHQRTEYNKRLLQIGDNGADITPKGGFLRYGEVKNPYLLVHGSLPGPSRRMVFLRHAVRYGKGVKVDEVQLQHISTASQQGA